MQAILYDTFVRIQGCSTGLEMKKARKLLILQAFLKMAER